MIIIWKCVFCESIRISNSKKRHTMDFCKCGKTGLDLEKYMSRISFLNSPTDLIILKRIKHSDYDIWQELINGTTLQGFSDKLDFLGKNKYYMPLDKILKLEKIEKEVLRSFLK